MLWGSQNPTDGDFERALSRRMEIVSCQLSKEQSFLASPWGHVPGSGARESRVTREPGLSLGMLEGTQGTVPWRDEHWSSLSLPLMSVLVFNHQLHVRKTFVSTSSILVLS